MVGRDVGLLASFRSITCRRIVRRRIAGGRIIVGQRMVCRMVICQRRHPASPDYNHIQIACGGRYLPFDCAATQRARPDNVLANGNGFIRESHLLLIGESESNYDACHPFSAVKSSHFRRSTNGRLQEMKCRAIDDELFPNFFFFLFGISPG